MAPFTPFFTEVLYQNLRKVCEGAEESIHYCSFPKEEGKVMVLLVVVLLIYLNLKEILTILTIVVELNLYELYVYISFHLTSLYTSDERWNFCLHVDHDKLNCHCR